jgi:hypothetical protein
VSTCSLLRQTCEAISSSCDPASPSRAGTIVRHGQRV